jgi:hypothetical protein
MPCLVIFSAVVLRPHCPQAASGSLDVRDLVCQEGGPVQSPHTQMSSWDRGHLVFPHPDKSLPGPLQTGHPSVSSLCPEMSPELRQPAVNSPSLVQVLVSPLQSLLQPCGYHVMGSQTSTENPIRPGHRAFYSQTWWSLSVARGLSHQLPPERPSSSLLSLAACKFPQNHVTELPGQPWRHHSGCGDICVGDLCTQITRKHFTV